MRVALAVLLAGLALPGADAVGTSCVHIDPDRIEVRRIGPHCHAARTCAVVDDPIVHVQPECFLGDAAP